MRGNGGARSCMAASARASMHSSTAQHMTDISPGAHLSQKTKLQQLVALAMSTFSLRGKRTK